VVSIATGASAPNTSPDRSWELPKSEKKNWGWGKRGTRYSWPNIMVNNCLNAELALQSQSASVVPTATVAGSTPGLALSGNNLGQVVHTHVPRDGDALLYSTVKCCNIQTKVFVCKCDSS